MHACSDFAQPLEPAHGIARIGLAAGQPLEGHGEARRGARVRREPLHVVAIGARKRRRGLDHPRVAQRIDPLEFGAYLLGRGITEAMYTQHPFAACRIAKDIGGIL